MKRLMNTWVIMFVLALVLSGCKDDPIVDILTHFRPNIHGPEKALSEERLQLALSRWRNNRIDSEPILIAALLSRRDRSEYVDLVLYIYDEEKNVIGCGIQEEYLANDQRTTRLEEYPCLMYYSCNDVVSLRRIPVCIRTGGHGKDLQSWQDYVDAKGIDVKRLRENSKLWQQSLPSLLVSIPDPNRIDVYIYIYDAAGHRSDKVMLVNCIPTDEQACAANLKSIHSGHRWDGKRVFGADAGVWLDPNHWCDVIAGEIRLRTGQVTPNGHMQPRQVVREQRRLSEIFTCPSVYMRAVNSAPPGESNAPNSTTIQVASLTSNYAMNPNCEPTSPSDMVLLFETKAGWNQHGGPELFSFENHDPKGGCVLFNDGSVRFIRTKEELERLRWK